MPYQVMALAPGKNVWEVVADECVHMSDADLHAHGYHRKGYSTRVYSCVGAESVMVYELKAGVNVRAA